MADSTDYHANYECAEGGHCLGELRHELEHADLPDSTKLEITLHTDDGREVPLRIIGGGRRPGVAEIDVEVIQAQEGTA